MLNKDQKIKIIANTYKLPLNQLSDRQIIKNAQGHPVFIVHDINFLASYACRLKIKGGITCLPNGSSRKNLDIYEML